MISQEKMIFRKIKSKSSQNRKTKIDVENRVAERTWWTGTYVVEPLGGGKHSIDRNEASQVPVAAYPTREGVDVTVTRRAR